MLIHVNHVSVIQTRVYAAVPRDWTAAIEARRSQKRDTHRGVSYSRGKEKRKELVGVPGPHTWLSVVTMLPAAKSRAQGIKPGGAMETDL